MLDQQVSINLTERSFTAATIGPLAEVPVLVILSWVALFLGERLGWDQEAPENVEAS